MLSTELHKQPEAMHCVYDSLARVVSCTLSAVLSQENDMADSSCCRFGASSVRRPAAGCAAVRQRLRAEPRARHVRATTGVALRTATTATAAGETTDEGRNGGSSQSEEVSEQPPDVAVSSM